MDSEDFNLENFVDWFMNLYYASRYVTMQKYENSSSIFTARRIQNIIVAGNVLDSSSASVDFNSIQVFDSAEKLRNYLKILLTDWYETEYSAGNVDNWEDFGKDLIFWENAKTVYKWNDMLAGTFFDTWVVN